MRVRVRSRRRRAAERKVGPPPCTEAAFAWHRTARLVLLTTVDTQTPRRFIFYFFIPAQQSLLASPYSLPTLPAPLALSVPLDGRVGPLRPPISWWLSGPAQPLPIASHALTASAAFFASLFAAVEACSAPVPAGRANGNGLVVPHVGCLQCQQTCADAGLELLWTRTGKAGPRESCRRKISKLATAFQVC